MESLSVEAGVRAMFQDYCGGNDKTSLGVVASAELTEGTRVSLLNRVVDVLKSMAKSVRVWSQEFASENDIFNSSILADVDLLIIFSGTKSIFREKVLKYLNERSGGPAVFRVFDFSEELFKTSFVVPRKELDLLNRLIIGLGRDTKVISVSSDSGTRLKIDLDPRYEWTNSSGLFNNKYPGVFPPGEVNTFSDSVNGILICDGALNCSIGFPRSVLFSTTPLKLVIENSSITEFECSDEITMRFLRDWATLENSMRVGEVGFGTNPGSAGFVDFCSHLNERHPGLHIGFGTPTQSSRLVAWSCPVHLDIIPSDTTVNFDEKVIFENGQYVLEPSGKQHSFSTLDVDAL